MGFDKLSPNGLMGEAFTRRARAPPASGLSPNGVWGDAFTRNDRAPQPFGLSMSKAFLNLL